MDREYHLLMQINENNQISQRQMAKVLNVSLGTINGLIQQMLLKGCITLDSSNPKQVKYFLTSDGHKEKAKKNYESIVTSYHTISKTKSQIRNILEKQVAQGTDSFFLYGEEDEVYKVAKMCLMELKREHPIHFHHLIDLTVLNPVHAYCVLYWNHDFAIREDMNSVNILMA